jgi:hypothetical protein
MEEPARERLAQASTQDAGRNNQEVQVPTKRRPDLLTFAAAVMFALGGFHVLLALSEFANSTWVLSRLDVELFIPILLIWVVIDLILGLIALYARVQHPKGRMVWMVHGGPIRYCGDHSYSLLRIMDTDGS